MKAAIRHKTDKVLQAKRMIEAGWSAERTAREVGASRETVRKWTDPEYANRARLRDAMYKRGQTRKAGGYFGSRMLPETKAQILREMVAEGLEHRDVAKVMGLLFGVELSPAQVRYAAANGSVPRPLRRAA